MQMKRLSVYLAAFAFLALIIGSCGKKQKAPEIGELVDFKDAAREFSVKIPKNFQKKEVLGKRIYAFSSQEALSRLNSPTPEGPIGVSVDVTVQDLTDSLNLETVINNSKLFQSGYKAVEQTTVNGNPASKLVLEFELNDGIFHSEKYFIEKEKVVTTITFTAFASTYDNYKAKFDEMLNSLQPATPVKPKDPNVKIVETEQPYPAEPLSSYAGPGFTIGRPENMTASSTKTANTIGSVNMISARRADCSIQIDVMDAKKSDLKFFTEQFKAAYKTSARDAKVGAYQGAAFDYSFQKGSKSRAYVAVNNGKCYRITMNWYAAEQDKYLPLFEKAISMFKAE